LPRASSPKRNVVAIDSADETTVKAVVEEAGPPPLFPGDAFATHRPELHYAAGEWYFTCHLHQPIVQFASPSRDIAEAFRQKHGEISG
jgi:hypothetical protein